MSAWKPNPNPGIALQRDWRWNGKPLRIHIHLKHQQGTGVFLGGTISWDRWFPRERVWKTWRSYSFVGSLRDAIRSYRNYANEWRGGEF